MALFKTPSPREFSYKPRFYDPEKEEQEETGKRQLHFRRILRRPPLQKKPVTRLVLLFILLIFGFWYLQEKALEPPKKLEAIQVEEIAQ